MRMAATISEDGVYRYTLSRTWDDTRPKMVYVMLNPSTADAMKDDATIRSCIRLAKDVGYGAITVVNLFAFRATDPKELVRASDPVGPENDDWIRAEIARSGSVVVAWGADKTAHKIVNGRSRAATVRDLIKGQDHLVMCLGKTKAGHPKHPLYIKSGTVPIEF